MRNVMNSMRYLLLLLFLSSFLFSCENKMDEHYEKPGWLKGSAWDVLANEYEGKYSIFLEAAELADFVLFWKVRHLLQLWHRIMMPLWLIWRKKDMFR